MKLFTVSSAIIAASIFDTILANERFNCDGITFSYYYVTEIAKAAIKLPLYSVSRYPKPYVCEVESIGREGYIEFPILSSEQFWRGGGFSHRIIISPSADTINVWSDLNGGHECITEPVPT